MRIVSLVPSLTHMLCDFGLQEKVVGCTQFCVEPKNLHRTATLVGGTKDPSIEAIAALRADRIFVNSEENKPEHIEECRKLAPTLETFPRSPHEVPAMLRQCAAFVDLDGESFAGECESAIEKLESVAKASVQKTTYLYLIWREPYMAAGFDTYISRMLELAGYENSLTDHKDRYPAIGVDEMVKLNPKHLFLSSEPYPFRKRDADRLRLEWPGSPRMLRADGQALSWYGTMTAPALRDLEQFLRGRETALFTPFSD